MSVVRTGVATMAQVRLSVIQDKVNPLPDEVPFTRTAQGFKTVVCDAGWDNLRLQQTLLTLAPQWANEIGPPVNAMPVLCELGPS